MRVKRTGYIPHQVVDRVVDNHAALDTDTGHFICHYKMIGLAVVEVEGKEYPALTVGDCVAVVNDPSGVKAIVGASEPVESSRIPPRGVEPQSLPLQEAAGILSMLEDGVAIEIRRSKESKDTLVFIAHGEHDIAFIVEKCRRPEEKGAILQV